MEEEYLSDISFVIVAKNEEFGINKCLGSLKTMPLIDCEVICVDSGSDDSTLEVMKGFADSLLGVRIYKCSGYSNSAISRNIGIQNASKNLVFFIDGDIEVDFNFIKISHDFVKRGDCDVITGQLAEIYYDESYLREVRRVKDRFRINKQTDVYYSGGCFMANRSILTAVGLFDERMERNQDIDFTLRLSRYGHFIAIPVSMGIHHTQEYNHRPRYFIQNRFPMFFGMLIRKNIDRPRALIALMKQNRGILIGMLLYGFIFMYVIGEMLCFAGLNLLFFVIIFFIIAADIVNCLVLKKNIANQFLVHYINPLFVAAGIFFDHSRDDKVSIVEQVF